MTQSRSTATTDVEPAQPPIPRWAIELIWRGHRALLRLSGGRLGLSRPEHGTRMGMLRLRVRGRRTGVERAVVLGYWEDGANLVTLAMNGWGEADPAWWLNLQAEPDAVVDLVRGRRTVRARAAEGDERDRLWRGFADYPGWGDDIDRFAARRPRETAVVVLEPRN